jgi:hypothetical protein
LELFGGNQGKPELDHASLLERQRTSRPNPSSGEFGNTLPVASRPSAHPNCEHTLPVAHPNCEPRRVSGRVLLCRAVDFTRPLFEHLIKQWKSDATAPPMPSLESIEVQVVGLAGCYVSSAQSISEQIVPLRYNQRVA